MAVRLMPERDCQGCTRQDEWGCEAEFIGPVPKGEDPRDGWVRPAHLPLNLDGVETFACPRQTLRRDPVYWAHLLKYYAMYNKGFLPQSGAIVDQCNKTIEVFRILDQVNGECDEANKAKESRPKGDPFVRR